MKKEPVLQLRTLLEKQTTNLTDNEALSISYFVPRWKENRLYRVNDRVSVKEGNNIVLYKCIQEHTSQASWKPSINTASLWTRIDELHEGTLNDPIPYKGNMALENGKYYTQADTMYLCTRDTSDPVFNALSELVGLYVEAVGI